MIELLTGLLVYYLTEISRKTKINIHVIVLVVSLFCAFIYYFAIEFFPSLTNQLWVEVLAIYGAGQIVYNFINGLVKDE